MALLHLLCLCLFMFASSLLVGLLPLFFSLSPRRVRYMTTVGVGLLVGVAFIVIIPEGVHTYYAPDTASHGHSHSHSHSHSHDTPTAQHAVLAAATDTFNGSNSQHSPVQPLHTAAVLEQHEQHSAGEQPPPTVGAHRRLLDEHGQPEQRTHDMQHSQAEASLADESSAGSSVSGCVPAERDSSRVGMALVAGFVLMLLVDRAGGGHDGHSHGGTARQRKGSRTAAGPGGAGGNGGGSSSVSGQKTVAAGSSADMDPKALKANVPAGRTSPVLSSASLHPPMAISAATSPNLASTAALTTPAFHQSSGQTVLSASTASSPALPAASAASASAVSSSSSPAAVPSLSPAPLPNTALLGILTHSAIDGLALGAISVSDNSSLELVVFLAIVLHKGPAAFGLASFLLYQGRSRQETRWHLVVFSAAAPVTSIVTYLLFLQRELLTGAGAEGGAGGGVSSEWLGLCLLFSAGTFLFTIAAHILPEVSRKEGELVEWRYVLCLTLGILLPLALNSTHHHH